MSTTWFSNNLKLSVQGSIFYCQYITMPDILSKNSRKIPPNSLGFPSLRLYLQAFFLWLFNGINIFPSLPLASSMKSVHFLITWEAKKITFLLHFGSLTFYSTVLLFFFFFFQRQLFLHKIWSWQMRHLIHFFYTMENVLVPYLSLNLWLVRITKWKVLYSYFE